MSDIFEYYLKIERSECGICGGAIEPCGNPNCLGNERCVRCLAPT